MFKLVDANNDKHITIDEIIKAINDTGEKNCENKFQDVDLEQVKSNVFIDKKE